MILAALHHFEDNRAWIDVENLYHFDDDPPLKPLTQEEVEELCIRLGEDSQA